MEPVRKSLFDSLDAAGKLDPVRSQLRAILFHQLKGSEVAAAATTSASSPLSRAEFPAESLLVHELIRDYMQWAGMKHSLSVFQAEARMPAAAVPKKVMASEVGVPAAPTELPLLFSMLHECKHREAMDDA
jgi:lisH domain-containing protein FOPNL